MLDPVRHGGSSAGRQRCNSIGVTKTRNRRAEIIEVGPIKRFWRHLRKIPPSQHRLKHTVGHPALRGKPAITVERGSGALSDHVVDRRIRGPCVEGQQCSRRRGIFDLRIDPR